MPHSSPDSHHSSHSPQKRQPKRHSSSQQDDSSHNQGQKIHRSQSRKHQGQFRREKRSRSRDRHHKKSHKHHSHHHDSHERRQGDNQNTQKEFSDKKESNSHKKIKQYQSSNLEFFDHIYFLQDENSKVSVEVAIWNTIIVNGYRPKKIIIICQNQRKITKLIKSSTINRKCVIIDQDSKQDLKLLTKSYDIVIMTQQKSSITLGLDQGDITLFDIVINYGKSYSVQYYSLLPQFLGQHGIIFSVFQDKKELQRHEKKLKINFKQVSNIQISRQQIQKQIFNQLQIQKRNTSFSSLQDLVLLKQLPFSLQQTLTKLFSLVKQKYEPKKSIYCKRQGYVTFCLKTDTQFNSIKYVWNFIREEMSGSIVKNVRDMKKFQNQRGVLFNIPFSDINKWESFQSKIQKNQKKYKGYRLYEWLNQELPKLQNTQSEEYKLLQMRKEQAMKRRHQLELFIAGVPYDLNEVDIRKFFADRHINLFMIRILRDGSGFSKGIAFGLAQNEQHFDRAMKLNGQKFNDRQLRIKLADQRQARQK